MAEEGDHLRCTRNDGRSWRCKLPAMPGKLICKQHLEKDRIRYEKRRTAVVAKRFSSEPIPENPPPPSPPPASPVAEEEDDAELRVLGRDHLDRQKKRKRSWAVDMIDAYSVVDDVSKKDRKGRTWRQKGLNSEDIEKQEEEDKETDQEEKEKSKESSGKEVEDNGKEKKKRRRKKTTTVVPVVSVEEVTRDLPHGRMAIYLPLEPPVNETSAQPSGDAPPPPKLGLNRPTCRLVDRNCRTKNVEPPPISTVKAVPYAANVRDKATTAGGRVGAKRKCHWCKTNCVASLIKCLSCKKRSFCSDCIKKRCIDAKELEKRCTVCRGTCECNSCLTSRTKDANSKESSTKQRTEIELRCFHYMISLALPILEKINEEQRIELETEAKLKELENSAREIVLGKESAKILDASLHCSLCSAMAKDGNKKGLLEVSRRKHPGDNFLYSPSIHDDAEVLLTHFQNHWRNSHPVVVRNLLEEAVKMEWDPVAWFTNYLNMYLARSEDDKEENDDPNCMDWYKVDFSSQDTFSGSMSKTVQSTCETLKLKARLSSAFSQRVFADRYAVIVDALPIQEYTNPGSGILNLAAKSAEGSQVSGFSPHVYITCGNAEEIRRGELVSELIYSSHDLVNILVHASDFSWSSDEITKTKTLMRRKMAKDMGGGLDAIEDRPVGAARNSTAKVPGSETGSDSSVMCSGTSDGPVNIVPEPSPSTKQTGDEKPSGMQWDIFRRQDTPKLVEYIKKHSNEFYNPCDSSKQITDPILEGSFYLDTAHKMKLKDEFKIEPWTFTQKLGEAVIIPAGCPYQNRSLKSCMNVVVGFLSPENAGESIKLADKLEAISADHKAKPSKLEVQKMVINKIGEAIKELRC